MPIGFIHSIDLTLKAGSVAQTLNIATLRKMEVKVNFRVGAFRGKVTGYVSAFELIERTASNSTSPVWTAKLLATKSLPLGVGDAIIPVDKTFTFSGNELFPNPNRRSACKLYVVVTAKNPLENFETNRSSDFVVIQPGPISQKKR